MIAHYFVQDLTGMKNTVYGKFINKLLFNFCQGGGPARVNSDK